MNVYIFNLKEPQEYLRTEQAILDPLEYKLHETETYLIPSNGTTIAPVITEGYANVWDGSKWELVEDHRGTTYYLESEGSNAIERTMEELGPLPDGSVLEKPSQTIEQKQEDITSQYTSDKATLMDYYIQAMALGDTDTMREITNELAELNNQYDIDMATVEVE